MAKEHNKAAWNKILHNFFTQEEGPVLITKLCTLVLSIHTCITYVAVGYMSDPCCSCTMICDCLMIKIKIHLKLHSREFHNVWGFRELCQPACQRHHSRWKELCWHSQGFLEFLLLRVNSYLTLQGFDQTINLILDETHERVYSATQGVEQVSLNWNRALHGRGRGRGGSIIIGSNFFEGWLCVGVGHLFRD